MMTDSRTRIIFLSLNISVMKMNIFKRNKLIILFIAAALIVLVFLFATRQNQCEHFENDYENEVSILAIFKNETMNLKTWVDHYLWQGVEKLYLIDNASTDEPLKILQPYIDRNQVVYYYLPERHKQPEHYRHVVEKENLKHKTKWLILCDLDEFYYAPSKKLRDVLLDDYDDYDIIYSNWYMFGSDGLIDHPEDIRTAITMRSPDVDGNTKCIFKPSRLQNLNDINIHGVSNIIGKSTTENEKIRLNHYPIQSLEFYKKVKMTRGDATNVNTENIRDMNYFKKYDENKTFKDTLLKDLWEKSSTVRI